MHPDEIEEMLYHRAVHSKIRPRIAQRLSNLAYNRMVTGGVMAGAALVCTLAMNNTGASALANDNGYNSSQRHPQLTDTDPKKHPAYQVPMHAVPDNTDPMTASLAMSQISN
jgi:hypothetical protein